VTRNLVLFASLLTLAACGQQAPGAPQSTEPAPSAAPAGSTPAAPAGEPTATATPIARTTSPTPGEPDDCGASKLTSFVGQQSDAATKAKIATASGAGTIRYIGPGDAVTMDYSPARLNVETDANGRITRVRCG
jgi:predicted small lipoprotein YifL